MFGLFRKKAKADASIIVPRIKHTNFLVALAEVVKSEEDTPVMEPLVGDLLVTYALDLPEMFQMVSGHDLQKLGLSPEQLRPIAIDNLKHQIGEVGQEGEPPVLQLVVGNDLEACLLLVDGVWKSLAQSVPGEIVVGVPARDVLLVTRSDPARGAVEVLREAVQKLHSMETTHALTRNLLVRRNNGWEVFEQAA